MTPAFSALLLGLALLGLPLFLVILGATLLGQHAVGLRAPVILVEIFDKIVDNPIFVSIPLFAHAGFVLSHSRAPARLVELSRAALGWLPGGSALVALAACAAFTAFTGASGVTIIALGGLLIPLLTREGYPERFNLGLVTTGGSLGLLFPPSLPVIVYALIASSVAPVAVDTLFLAGAVPGALLFLVLAVYGGWMSRRSSTRERHRFEPGRVLRAAGAAAFELPIPLLVVGGIYGGFLSLSQAAALVAVYVSAVEIFVYRDIDVRTFLRVTAESMVLVGGILVIVMGALALTNFLTDQEVPSRILAAMEDAITSRGTFLLALNVFLLAVGCVMDIYSAILVVVPLLLPVALRFGVDPVHFGIVFLANLEIGYSTPPVGINLFISSLRFGKPVMDLYRASVPFLGLLILALGVITYAPGLSLGLVRAAEGTGSAELVWKRREAIGGGGRGVLRWSRRAPGTALEWDEVATPPTDAPSDAREDLVLRYRPVDSENLAALREGGRRVRCSFDLSRGAGAGWPLVARWEGEIARIEDLAGFSAPLEGLTLRPQSPPFPAIEVRAENWSASRIEIESASAGRARGVLRGVIVRFTEEPDAPEEVYDVEVAFECAAEIDAGAFESLPADAPRRAIPDVRVARRPLAGGGFALVLERVRTRPFDLHASWSVPAASLEALAGSEHALDAFRVAMEDLDEEVFPGSGVEVRRARVRIDAVGGDRIAGRVQGVLQGARGTFDVEGRFDLPLLAPGR